MGLRHDLEEVKTALEYLGVVARVEGPGLQGKIDFRKNLVADYTAAFSPEFLTEKVILLIREELLQEIHAVMRQDRRTARLIDGVDGAPISEKRRGTWKEVPPPTVKFGSGGGGGRSLIFGEGSPIEMEVFTTPESVTLTVSLNHPLYIVMHSGSRPHGVPPFHGVHVFPTLQAIEKNENWKWTKYGPEIADLRQLPWRDSEGPSGAYYERYRDRHGIWKVKPRKARLKMLLLPRGTPLPAGGVPGHPFIKIAWNRVIRRNRQRTQATITQRMKSRGIL